LSPYERILSPNSEHCRAPAEMLTEFLHQLPVLKVWRMSGGLLLSPSDTWPATGATWWLTEVSRRV